MTEQQAIKTAQLFKTAIHADITEALLEAVSPIRNVENQELMYAAVKLHEASKRYRLAYEKIHPAFKEKIGEITDKVDEELMKIL